ncbi:hypothetical protein SK128_002298 [Halocaridina rubra]|uniref:Uncharacterized protein n=1 Tax=Halocaridina rubra TaxID=373956 RepID=A0AAN9A105_HALRR
MREVMSSFCKMMENVNQTKTVMIDKDQNEIQANRPQAVTMAEGEYSDSCSGFRTRDLHHAHHTAQVSNDPCSKIPRVKRQCSASQQCYLMLKHILCCWEQGNNFQYADSPQMSRTSASQMSYIPASKTSHTPASSTSHTPASKTSHTPASPVTTADSQRLQLMNAHLPTVNTRGRPKESKVLGRFNHSKVDKAGVKRKARQLSTKGSKRARISSKSNDA